MLNRRGFFGTLAAAVGLLRQQLHIRVNTQSDLTINGLEVKPGQRLTIENIGTGTIVFKPKTVSLTHIGGRTVADVFHSSIGERRLYDVTDGRIIATAGPHDTDWRY